MRPRWTQDNNKVDSPGLIAPAGFAPMPLVNQSSLLYLWDLRTLFLGPLAELLELSQAAATLVLGLDHEFVLESAGELVHCRSALLPAGSRVRLQPGQNRLVVWYLDPFGADFGSLRGRMARQEAGLFVALEQETGWIARHLDLLQEAATPEQAYALIEQLLGTSSADASVLKIDPRILRVVELIKRDVSNNLSARYLAAQVDLSEPRLSQLFKDTLGVPIRRYRQWHRLFVTAVGVTRGLSLTTAALEAGFTDSAHFSRTFRSILGMTPSAMLSPRGKIRMYAG
ncbi:MAG: AraC family transcriptional regulator [Pseudomonas sp.]|uniref:AraC family transcriptional regulator n=1 Tax=Pseudomonas sp. TaxID=306 RepID=UPI003BB59589